MIFIKKKKRKVLWFIKGNKDWKVYIVNLKKKFIVSYLIFVLKSVKSGWSVDGLKCVDINFRMNNILR